MCTGMLCILADMKAIQLNNKMREKIFFPDFSTRILDCQPLTTVVLFKQLGSCLLHFFFSVHVILSVIHGEGIVVCFII